MFKTKEFWVAALDLVVSIVLYFGGKYLGENIFEDVKFLIAVLQPFVLLIIGYFFAQGVKNELRAFGKYPLKYK